MLRVEERSARTHDARAPAGLVGVCPHSPSCPRSKDGRGELSRCEGVRGRREPAALSSLRRVRGASAAGGSTCTGDALGARAAAVFACDTRRRPSVPKNDDARPRTRSLGPQARRHGRVRAARPALRERARGVETAACVGSSPSTPIRVLSVLRRPRALWIGTPSDEGDQRRAPASDGGTTPCRWPGATVAGQPREQRNALQRGVRASAPDERPRSSPEDMPGSRRCLQLVSVVSRRRASSRPRRRSVRARDDRSMDQQPRLAPGTTSWELGASSRTSGPRALLAVGVRRGREGRGRVRALDRAGAQKTQNNGARAREAVRTTRHGASSS